MNEVTDILLYHDSFISLHAQLHNQLRQLILSGRWSAGMQIPSENQLTNHFNISRSTVRLALQQVELEGLIERIPGKGTFVAQLSHNENQSRLLAFIICNFDAANHLLMLAGAESEVKARGYQIVFSHAQSHEEEFNILQRMHEEEIAGILLWPNAQASRPEQGIALRYQQVKVPMVLMDRQIYGLDCDCVTSDNYGGTRVLMEHLLELGHERIVFLSHHETQIVTVRERYRAYRDSLKAAGLSLVEPWLIGQSGHEITAAYALQASVNTKSLELQQLKEYLLNVESRPTAIFALNDYLAVLAMRAMKLLNLDVPDAISVVGFDDIDLAVQLEVPLTTVAQDAFMIGKQAARLLIDRLEGCPSNTNCEIIPTQLRIRSSTSVPVQV